MTWRKLFRYLFLGSALMLVGVWAMSLGYQSGAQFRRVGGMVGNGSLTINILENRDGTWISAPAGYLYPPSQASHQRTSHHPLRYLGRWHYRSFQGGKTTIISSAGNATIHWIYHLYTFPLWVPWLLFVVLAFTFCRLMERRSGSGKEKELAVSRDADASSRQDTLDN